MNTAPHIIIPMSEQIDQFFAPNGTLISIPVKAAKKIAVLKVIASKLSPDTKYPEKELNAIIATYHQDTAAIRRHMIEYGILERDGGSVYWVKDQGAQTVTLLGYKVEQLLFNDKLPKKVLKLVFAFRTVNPEYPPQLDI